MARFVAFRYPDEAAFFIEESDSQEVTFNFVSFDKKRISIQGFLQVYDEQLRKKKITHHVKNHITSKEEFIEQSNRFKTIMQTTDTYKIVLSRIQIEKATSCNLHDIFETLCAEYTKELVYLARIDDSVWCGATPEILANIYENTVETVALASTKSASENRNWTKKEILEHQYVEDFYHELAKKKHVEILKKSETTDIQTGELLHLKSYFYFQINPTSQSDFIEQLHPTPAVSGLPQKEAIQHIYSIERHNRNWYTGYLGLNMNHKSKYYVNLRCMELGINASHIYVGGGHTVDSNAEKEWHETNIKSNAMRKVLKQCEK